MKSVLRHVRFLIFIAASFLQAQAHSAEGLLERDYAVELPSVEQLSQLKIEQQDIYWLGLRALVIELEESEGSAAADYAQNNFFSLFINKAYASVENLCVYAGFLLERTSDNLCPRPPACKANDSLIQCSPLLYGPDVCVSRGSKATASCERSARMSSKVREYRNKNPRSWAIFQEKVQEYCRKGKQASPCKMIRNRLDEIRQTVGNPTQIPVQVSAVRQNQETDRSTEAKGLEPVGSASGSDGGCYSEVLVQGIRFSNSTIKQFIEPEMAYRAFCQADAGYLKSIKNQILKDAQDYLAKSARAKNSAKPRYEQVRLSEQHSRINSGIKILKKCIAHIEGGKTLPSARSGTIEFRDDIVQILGKNGWTPMFSAAMAASSLNLMSNRNLGARFCDYTLISRKGVQGGSATTDTAAPIKSER
jgi:hypothetical protein